MRHIPEAGAVCGNSARTDLRGGRGVNLRSYRNNRGLDHPLPQRFDCSGGMVWAIGSRLILSKAQKSAGTNGPNHAGRVLVGLVMEVSSGAGIAAMPVAQSYYSQTSQAKYGFGPRKTCLYSYLIDSVVQCAGRCGPWRSGRHNLLRFAGDPGPCGSQGSPWVGRGCTMSLAPCST
jgi:hypothetical protein